MNNLLKCLNNVTDQRVTTNMRRDTNRFVEFLTQVNSKAMLDQAKPKVNIFVDVSWGLMGT